jgi:hypothetical protein
VRARLRLSLPYALAALVLGMIVLDNVAVHTGMTAAPAAMTCHDAASASASTDGGGGMAGLPAPVYYSSIAIVLLLSFALIERKAAAGPLRSRNEARVDLLRIDWLKRLVVHPATRFVAQLGVVALFLLVIAAGLFGNQLPTKNIAPLLTWTIWWGGLIVLILYVGKAWCYVCPWDAISGWAEGLRLWGPAKGSLSLGLRWPKMLRNIWMATFFFVALTWIELGFGVTMRPRATAWLALGMLGLAFVSAFVFDRKSFCRYGCLVGQVSGLYSLFAPVELRSREADVCRSCTTKSCYKGNELGDPCPTFQFAAVMDQNTYCISCMECVKTCESDNIGVNLRPWGEDLVSMKKPRLDEAYLALILLALTGFHGLTMTSSWGAIVDGLRARYGWSESLAFSLGMAVIIAGPIILYAGVVWLARRASGDSTRKYRDHFIRYAYALLPIALFYHLAHNSEHLLMEGQRIIALASDPFGFEWNLFGTATWELAPLVSMTTLWGIQVILVLVGHVYSLWVARDVAGLLHTNARAARASQIPMLASMIAFSVMSLWLLKQPMTMRMSWM